MMPLPVFAHARSVSLSTALLVGALAATPHAQSQTAFERGRQSGTPVTITGELTAIFADDFERGRSELMHFIRDSRTGRSFRIHLDREAPAHWRSGSTMTVAGRASGSELYVLAASTDPNTSSPTSSEPSTPTTPAVVGDQKTLVMVANFTDASVSCSVDAIDNVMFADPTGVTVDNLYREASLGQISFSGQVVGPFGIDATSTDSCDLGAWASAADSAAAAAGVDLAAYPRKMYVMPPNSCPGAGFGNLGGATARAWVFACELKGVYSHELGHNLGFDHASTPTAEYGDYTDPMAAAGSRLRGINAPHRHQLGWLAGDRIQHVTESGVYDLASLAADPFTVTAPQTLILAKPDSGELYYLSYRLAEGFDNYIDSNFYERLSIHQYRGDGQPARTYRLAGLANGESFSDLVNGITVTLISHTSTHATVQVELTNTCTSAAPSITLSPAAQSAAAGVSRSYAVTFTNHDSPQCSASTFALTAETSQGWSGVLSPTSLNLQPSSTVGATLTVTSPAAAEAGTFPIAVNATDALIAVHAVSAAGSYTVTVPCLPLAPMVSASPAVQTGAAGATLTYALEVSNRDNAACAASTFTIQLSVPAGWSGAASAPHVLLAPGQSHTLQVVVTSAPQSNGGSFFIRASVADSHQATHTNAADVTYTVAIPADTAAPTSPMGLTATTNSKLKQIRLAWQAATDNVGVAAYLVRRNGLIVATTTTTDWVDTAWIAGATHTYSVLARDAAGNISAPNGDVTVTISGGGRKR